MSVAKAFGDNPQIAESAAPSALYALASKHGARVAETFGDKSETVSNLSAKVLYALASKHGTRVCGDRNTR